MIDTENCLSTRTLVEQNGIIVEYLYNVYAKNEELVPEKYDYDTQSPIEYFDNDKKKKENIPECVDLTNDRISSDVHPSEFVDLTNDRISGDVLPTECVDLTNDDGEFYERKRKHKPNPDFVYIGDLDEVPVVTINDE